MKSFEERENRRKKSVVGDIIDVQKEETKEKRDTIARTFYIGTEHVRALAFEKAETGKDLSEIVREALDNYFGDKLDNYK